MRLTHEAIRGGLEALESSCQNLTEGSLEETRHQYEDVSRVIRLHAKQEDEAFYPKLEERRPHLTDAFTKTHLSEREMFLRLSSLFEQGRQDPSIIPQIKESTLTWIANHRKHLKEEEEALSHILSEVFLYNESVEVVRGILSVDIDELKEHHLHWVFQRLNSDQRDMYLAMLNACSPPDSLEGLLEVVKQ